MTFKKVVIVSVKRYIYRIHFWSMIKDKAVSLIKNSDLNEKSNDIDGC